MKILSRLFVRTAAFQKSESGSLTLFGLYIFMTTAVMSAIAIDVAHLYSARAQLQVAADVAAHAALYSRDTLSEDEAKAKAFDMAQEAMPKGRYGDVLRVSDINFGFWNASSQVFQTVPGARSAVLVTTSRMKDKANPVGVFLMQVLGITEFDIRTQAVFESYVPSCMKEGFMADGVVDIQSNNAFSGGFCIHSNTHVSMNNNNYFEPGTIVSMPDLTKLDIPGSGYDSNNGLSDALRQSRHHIRVVGRISDLIAGLSEFGGPHQPEYIDSPTVISINGSKMKQSDLVPGRVHNVTCGNGKLTFPSDLVVDRMVLITTCEVKMGRNMVVTDSIIATTSTGAKSFNGAADFTLGVDDNCQPGGGATLVTMGGMDFAAKLNIFGSQLLAADDISFAANANGIEGASIISGGRIDGTSNMAMGFCSGNGMEQILSVPNFRLAY